MDGNKKMSISREVSLPYPYVSVLGSAVAPGKGTMRAGSSHHIIRVTTAIHLNTAVVVTDSDSRAGSITMPKGL